MFVLNEKNNHFIFVSSPKVDLTTLQMLNASFEALQIGSEICNARNS